MRRALFAGLEEERHYYLERSGWYRAPLGAAEAGDASGYAGAIIGCGRMGCDGRRGKERCRRNVGRVAGPGDDGEGVVVEVVL